MHTYIYDVQASSKLRSHQTNKRPQKDVRPGILKRPQKDVATFSKRGRTPTQVVPTHTHQRPFCQKDVRRMPTQQPTRKTMSHSHICGCTNIHGSTCSQASIHIYIWIWNQSWTQQWCFWASDLHDICIHHTYMYDIYYLFVVVCNICVYIYVCIYVCNNYLFMCSQRHI